MTTHNRESLQNDLTALGVQPGDILFVHSSFKSLGSVDGGAGAVVAAMERAVGDRGLILMPTFHLIEETRRKELWDWATTPSTVGYLTEFFRLMPGTFRSDHFSHSVGARGRGAEAFVADHRLKTGLRSHFDSEPWGYPYGDGSPLYRAYRAGGRVLMLGVDYKSSTFIHLAEIIDWNERLKADDQVRYRYTDRLAVGALWETTGNVTHGKVGDADSRLFSIKTYVDAIRIWIRDRPEKVFAA